MHRCLELAQLGAAGVAPNPMVGAVLVHEHQIIGEGYHQQYGQAHAEVNCINSVKPEHRDLISQSTLYVSLEPCAHFGKTPPCSQLIIRYRIPRVFIGCRDPFHAVDGKGIELLKAAGVEVHSGILEDQCKLVNRRFFCFHTIHRPWIILKWAQTGNLKIAGKGQGGLKISNSYSNRLVHKWRSEEASILVGTNTALYDDPQLTVRLWPGDNPIRLVVDKTLRLPISLHLFDGHQSTIVFNTSRHTLPEKTEILALKRSGLSYYQVTEDVSIVHQIVHALYQLNIQSVLIEGGAGLLQSFIDENLWDEARVITNAAMIQDTGLDAPILTGHRLQKSEKILNDTLNIYTKAPQF